MKKFLIFTFLILISCQPDEILLPSTEPTQEMIFDQPTIIISDGQDISFEVETNDPHQLIITTQDGSVVSKETFSPTIGVNTRKIYTKSLPPNTYNLILIVNESKLGQVEVLIE